jgi:hypothetical protein
MIADVYYIITPGIRLHMEKLHSNEVVVYPFGAAESKLYHQYSIISKNKIDSDFCVLVDITQGINKKHLLDLTAFFFFPNYHRHNNEPIVLVHYNSEEDLKSFEELFGEQVAAQGFTQVYIQGINQAEQGLKIYAVSQEEGIRAAFKELIRTPYTAGKGLFIEVPRSADIVWVSQMLEQEEALIRQQSPEFYQSQLQHKKLANRIRELELICAAADQEIKSQAAHMQVLRSASQATQLQHYYNNEYEVLPSWYKQFGHLLKVVMGRRSLRSLFNGNVKKYKQ